MNPIGRRVITGVCLSAFWFCVIISQHAWLSFGALVVAVLLCHFEFSKMIESRGVDTCRWSGAAAAVAYLFYCFAYPNTSYVMPSILVFLLFARLLFDPKVKKPLESAAFAVLSFIYLPFMLSFFLRIAQGGTLQPFSLTPEGFHAVLYVVIITKMTDVGGYAIGIPFGKHKMFPRISPNKSWEGLIGGLLFSGFFSALFCYFYHPESPLTNLIGAAGLGVVIGGVGVVGDLIESMFKRGAEMKDSGGVFHGIGGLLDTVDSLIFTPAIFYLLFKVMQ